MRSILWGGVIVIVLGSHPSMGSELTAPTANTNKTPETVPLSDISSLVEPSGGECKGMGHCWALPGQNCRAAKLLGQLTSGRASERKAAVQKLGSPLSLNITEHPEVMVALITSLECDVNWEVREKAAWGIAYQNVANQSGWTCLYVASRLDPHWMVRDAAVNALRVIETQVGLDDIKSWKIRGDQLAKEWKSRYKPGKSAEPVLIF